MLHEIDTMDTLLSQRMKSVIGGSNDNLELPTGLDLVSLTVIQQVHKKLALLTDSSFCSCTLLFFLRYMIAPSQSYH